jgi:tRNA (guanine10-N2)-dimethyltransferase
MMQSLMILGRQPALGLAELESLYGREKLRPVGPQAVVVDVDPCRLAFNRLGGSVKFCKLLAELDTADWKEIEKFLLRVSPGHSERMPEGKMQLGLSLYGFNVSVRQIEATGLSLKKVIRKTGRSVRLVPNKEAELNSAQVLHNHLTGPTGWELVFIKDGNKTVVAQTVKAQDIDSYTLRDRKRPKRDARVGMLPPKLAQILINLAAGRLPEDKLENICGIAPGQPIPRALLNRTVLDPFCGTGVVLQEAALMGYDVYGTDLEPRMVEYTKTNLAWLNTEYHLEGAYDFRFVPGDATVTRWEHPIDLVASETYLGRPFTVVPPAEVLAQTAADCNQIIKKFLVNIHAQLKPGTRLCLAVPAWNLRPKNPEQGTPNGATAPAANGNRSTGNFKHLPLIDSLEQLGYNRISFEHAGSAPLLYYREDQITARELIVLTRQ